jgi:phosphoribosylglycinamide formyltransferase 1
VPDRHRPVPSRIAVLVSGSGTNLQALLDRIGADAGFGGEVVVVGADRDGIAGLARAEQAGIPTVVQRLADHPDRPTWERALRADLERYRPDVVVLAGFMKILSGAFLAGWSGRVINTHPSLLPAFRGAHAVREALEHGVKLTGSTVHLVDEEVDHGPIVAQRAVAVHPDDDEDRLHARIKAVEHALFPECVGWLCRGQLEVTGRTVNVRPDPHERTPTSPSPTDTPDGP